MTVLDSLPPPSKGATVPLGLGEVLAGKYRVEKLIGAGGMGLVVLAKHLELDQQVAIKLMREEALKDGEARARFAREAKAVVRLRSEHVARVTDVGTLDDGAPFLVMEYLQGNDLGTVLSDVGKLPIEEAVAYLLQICEGMAEAHGAGIIHRDLKPRNIFVTTGVDGAPLLKILDFGISKLVPIDGGTLDLSLTKTTDVMGSPSYMAPEQLRSARDADERSDIWSLGVMLYELITGRLPWEARSLTELGAMVLRDPPAPMGPEVTPELDAVVARCLEKDPAKRYPSVVDLAHALEPHARGLAAGSAERVMSVARTSRHPPAGRPSSPRARSVTTNKNARTSVSWGETEPDPPKLTLPPPDDGPSPRRVWILGALLALVVVASIGSLFALRAGKSTPATPPVLPEDRGALKPPATVAPPAPSVSVAQVPTPPATGTVNETAAPVATIPRRARAAPTTAAMPSAASAPPVASSANAHDMGAIPRK